MASPLSTFSEQSAAFPRAGAAGTALSGAHWLFGGHRLDVETCLLVREGHRMQLDERGFAVLTCLLRHAGLVVPRATLVAEAWPGIEHVTDSAVSKTMRRLRIALGNDAGRTLSTVYGVGYRLATPAVLVPAGTALASGTAEGAPLAGAVPAAPVIPATGANPSTPAAPRRRGQRHAPALLAMLLLALLVAWLLAAVVR